MSQEKPIRRPARKPSVGRLALAAVALVAAGVLLIDRPVRGLEGEAGNPVTRFAPPPFAQGLHFFLHQVEPPVLEEQQSTLKAALAGYRSDFMEDLPNHMEEASSVRSAIQDVLTDEQRKSARRLWMGSHLEGKPHPPGPLGRLAALRGILERVQPAVTEDQRGAIRDAVDEHVVPHVETLLERRAETAAEFASLVKETLSAEQIESVVELRNRYSAEKHFFDTLLED